MKREFLFKEFNAATATNFGNTGSWFQSFADGRFGLDNAIKLPLGKTFKKRLIYLYLFSLVPDWVFLGYAANTFSWVTLNVRLVLVKETVATFPVSIYSNPGGPLFRGPAPTNAPSCIPSGGAAISASIPFAPVNPLNIIHTTNSPEPAVTTLQPWPADFEADSLEVDILDTTMASQGLRIMAISYAW